jgi:hypothetical protein
MTRKARLALIATAVVLGAAGVAGLVSAQQGVDATGPAAASPAKPAKPIVPPPPPPADVGEEAPPPASAIKPGVVIPASPATEADDVEPDRPSSSAPAAKAAAAKPDQPMTRPRYATAIMQAMDKASAETMRFEVPINKPIRYKSLIFIVRACETNAPDEAVPDAFAHVEIDSEPVAQQGAVHAVARQVFRGWMFANAPGLHLFQSPAYDAWLIACKTASPAA